MGSNPFKPKKLVDANLVTEFGAIELTDEFRSEGVGQRDYSYVPGFSEKRVNRELDLAALHRGEIKGRDVRTLDENLRWFRRTEKNGQPDNSRIVDGKNQGYRPVTRSDVGQSWMTEPPPNSYFAADGVCTISGGDLVLMVCDKEHAARNAMRKKILTEEMVDGMEFTSGGLGNVGKHAEAFVEKTIGTQAKGDNQ
jgi:hypothetical protein